MTLPASPNAISLNNVNTEFGRASQTPIAMSDIYLRTLFSEWVNPISMSSGWGKSWPPAYSTVYTTAGQSTLVVPAGTLLVGIKAWGGGGGSGGRGTGTGNVSGPGGAGGFVWGICDAVAGETLSFNVGGKGLAGTAAGASPYAGEGGSGGGASWVRNNSRAGQPYICIIAGGAGGGGTGSGANDSGGPGGGGSSNGVAGLNNLTPTGAGGTAASGGSAGAGGVGTTGTGLAGGFLTGGNGSNNNGTGPVGGTGGGGQGGQRGNEGGGGGGGGSGWYGGGGGGWSANAGGGGGGGGSNYFAGSYLLYSLSGQTGTVGQTTYTYPNFGGPDWNNYGIGGYGKNSLGTGIDGFNGAIAFQFYTT